jgi:3-oxoacyl-[acyl-carrier-protein] synthase II
VLSNNVPEPIAIIGIGCRFPGAPNPQAFWKLLREGIEGVGEVPADRWDVNALHDPDPNSPGKMVSRRGGFIDNVDQFDWRAFRIPPREAKYMDPQQRLLLEVAWEALEDAGLPLENVAGSRTGVFMGIMWNDYLRLQSSAPSYFNGYGVTGNAFAFAPNRISYFFDLRGPSVAVDSACASSLVSVHAACQSLWLGETSLALAGGVNLMLSPDVSIMLSKAGLLSPEGRCATLDARADGFARGEGAGIVILKPQSQLTPSDRVYALIHGTAVNHNGHNEWIMAASPTGEEAALRDAYHMAGVEPAEIDYVELHGTGLPKGDVIEAGVLGKVIGTQPGRDHPCVVGSVKTNIGHLDAAAGIASIIKVALSIYHREIPPTLNLQEVNTEIDLSALGLAAQQTLGPWPSKKGPSLAGVTAVSLSGVNAHVVLGSAPIPEPPILDDRDTQEARLQPGIGQAYLLPLSARSPEALSAMALSFKNFLSASSYHSPAPAAEPGQAEPDGPVYATLQDICYTASVRRSHYEYRLALVGSSPQAFVESLEAFLQGQLPDGVYSSQAMSDDQDLPPDLAEAMARYPRVPRDMEALGVLYARGYALDWPGLYPNGGRCVQLPTYPWQRERLWLDWLKPHSVPENPSELAGETQAAKPQAVSEDASGPTNELLRRLEQAPQAKRQTLLRAYVRDQVAQVLGLDPSHSLDPQQGLFDAGLNSLAAVELVNRLRSSLGRSIPLTCVFDYPTVEALSSYLAREVLALESTSSATPPSQAIGSASVGIGSASVGIGSASSRTHLPVQQAEEALDLEQLEQLSEDEAEALLIEKLETMGRNLS